MEKFYIYEGFMDELKKKAETIRKKCLRFGCDFHFAETGNTEIRKVMDYTTTDGNGKHPVYYFKFIEVEAEGTAVLDNWQFVASVDHTQNGNIFNKAMVDLEIPQRYYCSDPYCEHCNSNRYRKNTCIVYNKETKEFKQVGNQCLKDFTRGMSVAFATYMASLKSIFTEYEEREVDFGGGWRGTYHEVKEILRYTAETIRHFGWVNVRQNDDYDVDLFNNTKYRVERYYNLDHGYTRFWDDDERDQVRTEMESVDFNPNSEYAVKETEKVLAWLEAQEENNDYIHNLKVIIANEYCSSNRFGILCSLFPSCNKDLEIKAKREAEAKSEKISEYIGQVGDRVETEIQSVKCVTSWETQFGMTFIYKFVNTDGNVLTWKTSKSLDEERCVGKKIKGTVKELKVFRDIKQTELTRCKIA